MKLFQVPVGALFVFVDFPTIIFKMLFNQPDGVTYEVINDPDTFIYNGVSLDSYPDDFHWNRDCIYKEQ